MHENYVSGFKAGNQDARNGAEPVYFWKLVNVRGRLVSRPWIRTSGLANTFTPAMRGYVDGWQAACRSQSTPKHVRPVY